MKYQDTPDTPQLCQLLTDDGQAAETDQQINMFWNIIYPSSIN